SWDSIHEERDFADVCAWMTSRSWIGPYATIAKPVHQNMGKKSSEKFRHDQSTGDNPTIVLTKRSRRKNHTRPAVLKKTRLHHARGNRTDFEYTSRTVSAAALDASI